MHAYKASYWHFNVGQVVNRRFTRPISLLILTWAEIVFLKNRPQIVHKDKLFIVVDLLHAGAARGVSYKEVYPVKVVVFGVGIGNIEDASAEDLHVPA